MEFPEFLQDFAMIAHALPLGDEDKRTDDVCLYCVPLLYEDHMLTSFEIPFTEPQFLVTCAPSAARERNVELGRERYPTCARDRAMNMCVALQVDGHEYVRRITCGGECRLRV
jgi:hypothetical protein